MKLLSTSGFVPLVAAALLAGCAGGASEPPASTPAGALTMAIQGSLTYRSRIALTPDAVAVVELREGTHEDGKLIGERRWKLEGKQVPVAFTLEVARSSLVAGTSYTVRGAFYESGRPVWTSAAKTISGSGDRFDVGALDMTQASPGGFGSVLTCGGETVSVAFAGSSAFLTAGAETFELRQRVSASGARYVAVSDSTTSLWNKGDETTVTIRGRTLPACTSGVPGAAPYRASGNEPGWRLDIANGVMTLRPMGGTAITAPAPAPQPIPGGRRYDAVSGEQAFTVTILERPCADSMSGMPHPNTVTVLAGGREYRGCGGDPVSLLQGAEWKIEGIGGEGIATNSRPTILFGAGGRSSGNGSCNSYSGEYKLTGEGLTFTAPVATLRACAEPLMSQETRFFEILRSVQRFEIGEDGALHLWTGDGRTITARR